MLMIDNFGQVWASNDSLLSLIFIWYTIWYTIWSMVLEENHDLAHPPHMMMLADGGPKV